MTGSVHIGTQGWNYDAWVGGFFPTGTRPADYLTVYARAFDTVEVDSTFYAVPSAKTVRGWASRVPASNAEAFDASSAGNDPPRVRPARRGARAAARSRPEAGRGERI